MNVSGGVALSGSGEVVLKNSDNLTGSNAILRGGNTSALPAVNEAGHTIRGEGSFITHWLNNGTIRAEEASGDTTATLRLNNGSLVNNGVIQSSSSSDLRLAIHLIQGATGQLIADTGKVSLTSSRINGGTLSATNGGFFESIDGVLRLEGVHLASGSTLRKFNMSTGSTLNIENGTFTNDGTVQIGMDATESTVLNFATSETIAGSGEIILMTENLGGVGSRIRAPVGIVGTFGANQTVRGVGAIEAAFVNNGTIIAEPRIGTILQLETEQKPKTNNGIIRADAGAMLRIRGTTINQDETNGQILANGGTVQLDAGGTIVGGRLEATGAGFFTVQTSGRLVDVTNNAPITAPAGNNPLRVSGSTLVNNNTITVNGSIIVDSSIALSGLGDIVLPTAINSRLSIVDGVVVTQQPGHVVHGAGQINGPGRFVNNGEIRGASAAAPTEINGTLSGTGLLKDIRIDGTHAPGNGVGSIPLEGAYSINNFAKLEIELGGLTPGTQHDQLSSTGTVTLATVSGLDVSFLDLANGYLPAAGDRFDIITSSINNIVGTFGNGQVTLPSVGFGRAITWAPVDYSDPLKVTLEIAAVNFFDADFDEDGDVDGDDLTRWQAGYSLVATATHGDGDADGDNDVDGRDFLRWQRQFGLGVAPLGAVSSSTTAVPEPASVALLGMVICLATFRRHETWQRAHQPSAFPGFAI